jgi:hypothetical protein
MVLPAVVFVLVMAAIHRRPAFAGEFVVEDFILLLALVSCLAPSKFQLLISRVIACAMSITMALMALKVKAHTLSLFVFALVATLSGILALIELSKLRKDPKGSSQPGS